MPVLVFVMGYNVIVYVFILDVYLFLLTFVHSFIFLMAVRFYPLAFVVLIDILTPVALAHVIMGDGTRQGSGLVICTDSFSVEEVARLMTVLYVRYDIDSTLQYYSGKPRIYIRASSMPTLRNLVRPYMHPSFMYKLGE
jgi:hypothetical protein